jgi:hypothetical protein
MLQRLGNPIPVEPLCGKVPLRKEDFVLGMLTSPEMPSKI